jgi:hypothetical protein
MADQRLVAVEESKRALRGLLGSNVRFQMLRVAMTKAQNAAITETVMRLNRVFAARIAAASPNARIPRDKVINTASHSAATVARRSQTGN